jgi:four helix bundle protein
VAVARHYSQLICWQLADSLRVQIYKVTSRAPCKDDFKRKGQLEDAIDSVCRNIAEGFGGTSHKEFARFLEISRRSLNEVMDCIRSAHLKVCVSGRIS